MMPENVFSVPWWQYPVYILHDLLAMACMTAVLSAARGFRERRRSLTVACCGVCAALAVLNAFLLGPVAARTDPDTAFLLYGAVGLAAILLLPQVILRASRRFSSALICLAVNVGMEGLFSIFGYLLDEVDIFEYHFYETVFCGAGYALAALFLRYAARNKDLNAVRATVELIPKWLYGIIILCSFYSYFSVMGRAPELYRFEKMSAALRALSVFGVLLFVGYFVFRVFSLMAQQTRILSQMDSQQRNYEALLQSDEQLRLFRHDYRNHMLVVTSLLNAGLMEDALDYLAKIRETSGIAARRFSTGNRVADALLNNKDALAREFSIDMTFSGMVPEKGVEPSDLCTVVGNLVDNAIEGVRRFPGERYIAVRAAVRDGMLTFSCVNPVAEKVTIKNNRIRTTKADAAHHGIGLKNVAAAAKKYHGGLLLTCDDARFTADVTLRLREDG